MAAKPLTPKMRVHKEPSVARVRDSLSYDTETGQFTWLRRPSNRVRIGQVAGSVMVNGYINITIDGCHCYGHRLAWLYVHGRWPVEEIDHINGSKTDNRIANLREATRLQNNGNLPRPSHNTSGTKGVWWNRACGKWTASISINNKHKYLGMFETREETQAAYSAAAWERFGEFMRSE